MLKWAPTLLQPIHHASSKVKSTLLCPALLPSPYPPRPLPACSTPSYPSPTLHALSPPPHRPLHPLPALSPPMQSTSSSPSSTLHAPPSPCCHLTSVNSASCLCLAVLLPPSAIPWSPTSTTLVRSESPSRDSWARKDDSDQSTRTRSSKVFVGGGGEECSNSTQPISPAWIW